MHLHFSASLPDMLFARETPDRMSSYHAGMRRLHAKLHHSRHHDVIICRPMGVPAWRAWSQLWVSPAGTAEGICMQSHASLTLLMRTSAALLVPGSKLALLDARSALTSALPACSALTSALPAQNWWAWTWHIGLQPSHVCCLYSTSCTQPIPCISPSLAAEKLSCDITRGSALACHTAFPEHSLHACGVLSAGGCSSAGAPWRT